jgi:N-acetylated-alpha-linked acidic dipeptidase
MATALNRKSAEERVVDSVGLDEPWELIERFSTLTRESGSHDERKAVQLILERLEAWGVPHELHTPELLISLPLPSSLTVDSITYRAKTPSMAGSTPEEGCTAPLLYQAAGFPESVDEIFVDLAEDDGAGEAVAGRIVLTEGFPMPEKVVELAAAGAVGLVCISPSELIHEDICTGIWGSPDLTTYDRKPTLPVVSLARSDGERLRDRVVAESPLQATMIARHDEGFRPVPVIVAEIRGQVEPERFVLVHGHIDSWHAGIGDNATGDATLLELARVLHEHGGELARSVRIAWWSGHSTGRYAGSAWYADAFALDLERNCVCHINCDSPGCRDADVYENVYWMA